MQGLHYNGNEWQRPKEFLPERFDMSSKLSLTPDGKKRSPMSWLPFNGGQRICFGKTFAEANLKIAVSYMTQYFDMEFVEKEKYCDPDSLPKYQLGQSIFPSVEVSLKVNN